MKQLNLAQSKENQSSSDSRLWFVWTVLLTCSLQGLINDLFITNLDNSSVTKDLGKYS